jgi:hypothetical protein
MWFISGSENGRANPEEASDIAQRATAQVKFNRNAANGAAIPRQMPADWGGFWTAY